jgi:RNA polymerase-binding transcription factor DksA
MTTIDTNPLKARLEKELQLLIKELQSLGHINPSNPNDWEAVFKSPDQMTPDPVDQADDIEEFEKRTAILKQLEIRFNEVRGALARIEDKTFGICSVGGEEIEADRLEANPAAATCKVHM